MSSSTDDTLHPTDRWARAVCETAGPQDRAGRNFEDTARARLFGETVNSVDDPQDPEGRGIEDQAFAGLFGAAPRPSPSDPRRIGKYMLGASLGRGGMGEVFIATDTQLNRKVAIKLLRPRNPNHPLEHSRLLREAQALAALSHENVVGIHECGVHGDQVFLVMEYVEGCTLRAWQDAAPRPWREVLKHYLAAGRGLAAIHAAGLVHRDFKPQNVLVTPDGRIKVVDFGLVIAPGERAPQAPNGPVFDRTEALSLLATQLTDTSAVLGTPLYISPEQLAIQPLDARSDQFSFCVAMYEALYGGHPYAEPAPQPRDSQVSTNNARSRGAIGTQPSGPPSMMSLVTGLVEGHLRKPQKIVVSGRVYRALEHGLQRLPKDRYPSMTALLAALARDPLRKYGPWAGVAGFGIMMGAVAVMVTPPAICKDIAAEFKDAWTPAQAVAITNAFKATGSPHAETAARHVTQTLDAYRDSWLAARADNCESTHDRRTQNLEVDHRRTTCLDQARDTLAATAKQLTHADAATVEGVTDALALLPALETCSANFQRQQTCLDSADEPNLSGRLYRARAHEIAGKFSDAETDATAVLDAAGDHPRLAAEAQLLRGRVLAEQNRASEAADAFKVAYRLAEGAGCESLAFEAATRNTKLVALNYDLPAERGVVWSEIAQSKLQKLPESPRLTADLHSDRGLLLQHREDLTGNRAENLAQAAQEHNTALELRQQIAGERKTSELALSYLNLSDLERPTRPELAVELANRSLEHFTSVYGPDHPLLWKPHRNLANALLELDDLGRARAELERALAIAGAGLGPGHGAIGLLKYTLATSYFEEDLDRALTLATAAQAIYVREIDDTDPQRIDPLVLLGEIHSDRNEPDQALHYRQEVLHRQIHASPGDRAEGHFDLAKTLNQLNRPDQALGHLQLASALLGELAPAPAELIAHIQKLEAEIVRPAKPTQAP